MKLRTIALIAALTVIAVAQTALADATNTFKAKLRPGVHVNLSSYVLTNPNAQPTGKTILYLHGMAHTGNTFRPLASEIFNNPALGPNVYRAIILNLPGRGGSGLPTGKNSVRFGDLNLIDYAEGLNKALREYQKEDISPSTIVAHSMGGLVVQVAQELLKEDCSSLHSEFGITDIVLLATSNPREVIDDTLESGATLGLIDLFKQSNATLGDFVTVDDMTFIGFFFCLPPDFTTPVPGTPFFPSTFGYKSEESYAAAAQTVSPSAGRPSVRANAFATGCGTKLSMIVGSLDAFSPIAVQQSLYTYLTGDQSLSRFQQLTGSDTVHDQYISNPAAVAAAIATALNQ